MKEIVTEIQINASPEKVWDVLMANHQWAAWNPFITQSVGPLVVGQKVKNTMGMKGRNPMTFKAKVLKADPVRELRWLGRVMIPGIFDGEHYFKVEAKDGGTRFVQGEIFRGFLVMVGMLNMEDVEASFIELNEALKKRVEA